LSLWRRRRLDDDLLLLRLLQWLLLYDGHGELRRRRHLDLGLRRRLEDDGGRLDFDFCLWLWLWLGEGGGEGVEEGLRDGGLRGVGGAARGGLDGGDGVRDRRSDGRLGGCEGRLSRGLCGVGDAAGRRLGGGEGRVGGSLRGLGDVPRDRLDRIDGVVDGGDGRSLQRLRRAARGGLDLFDGARGFYLGLFDDARRGSLGRVGGFPRGGHDGAPRFHDGLVDLLPGVVDRRRADDPYGPS